MKYCCVRAQKDSAVNALAYSHFSQELGWPKRLLTFIACAILFIWVITNTIALRNGLLVIGAITAIYIIISERQI